MVPPHKRKRSKGAQGVREAAPHLYAGSGQGCEERRDKLPSLLDAVVPPRRIAPQGDSSASSARARANAPDSLLGRRSGLDENEMCSQEAARRASWDRSSPWGSAG